MADIGAQESQDTRTEEIIGVDQGDAVAILDQRCQARKQACLSSRRQDQILLRIQRQIEKAADGAGKHAQHFGITAVTGVRQRTIAGGAAELLGGPWRWRKTHGVEMRAVQKVGWRLRKQLDIRAPRAGPGDGSPFGEFEALEVRGSLRGLRQARL